METCPTHLIDLDQRLRDLLPTPIAIVGYGIEGQSSLAFLLRHGFYADELCVFDQNSVEVPDGVRLYSGSQYLSEINLARTAVRTAGLPPKFLSEFQGYLTSQVELFFELYNQPFVAITGTFGKGTTLGLLESVLKVAQRPYQLGGNYGIPVLDMMEALVDDQIPLLELSSFQTMTLRRSAPIAAILTTTVEHLDWHTDVDEYRTAKAELVRHQQPSDLCVFAALSSGAQQIAEQSSARKIAAGSKTGNYSVSGGKLLLKDAFLDIADCASRGEHMLHNMSVAAAIADELDIAQECIIKGLRSFVGLPLRLELSAKNDRFSYYNDSYATRPEAALAAVRSFNEPLGLILGGSEKHVDFSELALGLKDHPSLVQICLIGQTAERLRTALEQVGFDKKLVNADSLEEAVDRLEAAVPSPGIILLSPACASFGMFKNYKHRGEVFHQIARSRC